MSTKPRLNVWCTLPTLFKRWSTSWSRSTPTTWHVFVIVDQVTAQVDMPIQGDVDVPPFLHTTRNQLERWTHDVETLEVAFIGSLRLIEPERIDGGSAQQVLVLLAGWIHQLHTSAEMLLLVRKLRCIDQLSQIWRRLLRSRRASLLESRSQGVMGYDLRMSSTFRGASDVSSQGFGPAVALAHPSSL